MIQFAKLSGFSPIITTASKHNEALLKSLGATHIIDRSTPLSDLAAAIKSITSKPLKIAYDAISTGETQNAAYDALAPGGKLETVLPVAVDKAKITPKKQVQQVSGSPYAPQHKEIGKSLYASVTSLLEAGDIKVRLGVCCVMLVMTWLQPNNVEVLPGGLAGIPDGLEKLRKGVSALKLVARPQETP